MIIVAVDVGIDTALIAAIIAVGGAGSGIAGMR